MSPVRRLAAILPADVVGYSRLMGVDEVATLQAHSSEVVDPAIVALQHLAPRLLGGRSSRGGIPFRADYIRERQP
jgi:class 3 adenylate cyclase